MFKYYNGVDKSNKYNIHNQFDDLILKYAVANLMQLSIRRSIIFFLINFPLYKFV